MPVNTFEIQNEGSIKYAKCDDVSNIMIIADPNGVGKSTLLELIFKFLRPKVP